MGNFNNKEKESLVRFDFTNNKNIDVSISKRGTVKDNTIEYTSHVTKDFFSDKGMLIGCRTLFSAVGKDLDTLLEKTSERYNAVLQDNLNSSCIWTDEDGDRYLCGNKIYTYNETMYIFIDDEKLKIYTYDNDDYAVFIDKEKHVIGNVPGAWNAFKNTQVYKEKYSFGSTRWILVSFLIVVALTCLMIAYM